VALATAVDAAAAAAEATIAQSNPELSPSLGDGLRAAERAAANTANAVVTSPPVARGPARSVGGARRVRTPMPVVIKLQIIAWKDSGKTWSWIKRRLEDKYAAPTVRNAYRQLAVLLARVRERASEDSVTSRTTPYAEIDARLPAWFLSVRDRGRKRIPTSLAILRRKALHIATDLGITNFTASNGYLQRWARRHGLVNVALHGCGASSNIPEAAARMKQIRRQLAAVDPDLMYNVDETGLLFRCLPSRSYVPADDRRTARGSKAMRSKDRVTLTLCCNATGTHKLPVAVIRKAMRTLCFNGKGNGCPLPYCSQASAWTDGDTSKRWFDEVIIESLHARTASHVYLVLDNLGCHFQVSHAQVTVIELPSNTTAVYQPLYAGIIAALKRRFKTRLLERVVASLEKWVESARPAPRVPRGGGLGVGGQAHLLDAVQIIRTEWDKISTEQLANCWLKADVLPTEAAAEVRRQVHGPQPVVDNIYMDVSDLVALMANTSMSEEFTSVTESARASAVRRWLRAEDDAAAVDQTVDMVLASVDELTSLKEIAVGLLARLSGIEPDQ